MTMAMRRLSAIALLAAAAAPETRRCTSNFFIS